MATDPRLELTTADVAVRFGVHPKTVKRWATNGSLGGIRIGGRWRFSEAALEAFITDGKTSPAEASA